METQTNTTAESNPAPYVRSGEELETYKMHRRFDRMGRLVGDEAMEKLFRSHVMVIGLGGVGSWAAEALLRAGVGRVSIVDFDDVCITNTNRQMHALTGTVGQKKATVLSERLKRINPQARLDVHVEFYNKDSSARLLDIQGPNRPDYIIDAIDNVTAKCHLISTCRAEKIPLICSTGSAGRMDPTQIRVSDLADTEMDPLARSVRKILRLKYDFPEKGQFGIQAISSVEPVTMPVDLKYDKGMGFQCVCPQGSNGLHSCDERSVIMGSAGFVTGAFGMACASAVVKGLLAK